MKYDKMIKYNLLENNANSRIAIISLPLYFMNFRRTKEKLTWHLGYLSSWLMIIECIRFVFF